MLVPADVWLVSDPTRNAASERRDSFLHVYRRLRLDLVSGNKRPGDQIIVTDTARQLGISPTPVREALSRLSGERLVEDRRRHGFYVPLPSWFDLLELYELCEMYLVAAMRAAARERGAGASPEPVTIVEEDLAAAIDGDPFGDAHLTILSMSRNAKLVVAGQSVIDCLAAARRIEVGLFPESVAHMAPLAEHMQTARWREVFTWVREDFRARRLRAEPVAYALAAEQRARNRANIV